MQVKLLTTDGNGSFSEVDWNKPSIGANFIAVRSIMTGVCRSDIDMMQGKFHLPDTINMSGHEGLGQVIEIGENINDVNIGDYVATRGEPAYADIYNSHHGMYVKVPYAHPKYILEPVACGINLIEFSLAEIEERETLSARMLIIGSGMLAWIAYNTIKIRGMSYQIDVMGNNNKDLWKRERVSLKQETRGEYDVIIDLTGKNIPKSWCNEDCLLVMGTTSSLTFTGRDGNILTPTPHTAGINEFHKCMIMAEQYISSGELVVDSFWSKEYDRTTQWQQAFADGLNREPGYSRGYIKWSNNV